MKMMVMMVVDDRGKKDGGTGRLGGGEERGGDGEGGGLSEESRMRNVTSRQIDRKTY